MIIFFLPKILTKITTLLFCLQLSEEDVFGLRYFKTNNILDSFDFLK